VFKIIVTIQLLVDELMNAIQFTQHAKDNVTFEETRKY